MTEQKVKVLTVSDIHSVATFLDDLKEAVERHKPDILACVGDILDFEATSNAEGHQHGPVRRKNYPLCIHFRGCEWHRMGTYGYQREEVEIGCGGRI